MGSIIHWIEPTVYPTIFDGIWWSIVTISTVGYGDFVPKSLTGRLMGISLILGGIALFTFFVTNLATSTVLLKEQWVKGYGMYKKNSHLLVIGWNERSRLFIEDTHRLHPSREIVLIDETLQTLPKDYSFIRFIKGSPKQDETLHRANAQEAETVIVTANSHTGELQSDANTILILLTVKGVNPKIYAIAEIIKQEQVTNARRAGANEIIQASQHLSQLLMNGTLYHGLIDVIGAMLEHDQIDHLGINNMDETLAGKTFAEAITYKDHADQFLIGIRRQGESILHPPKDFTLIENDELIIFKR